ncbi:hypothetical protein ES703_22445 [subsurface metagenome]
MTYSAYCREHNQTCSPLYWRPEGRTFKRVWGLVYCPGDGTNGHILKETYYKGWPSTERLDKVEQ